MKLFLIIYNRVVSDSFNYVDIDTIDMPNNTESV